MTTKNSIKVTVNNTTANKDYDISISTEWTGVTHTVKASGKSVSTQFRNLKNGRYSIYVSGPCTHADGEVLCENNRQKLVNINLPKGKSKIRVVVTGRLLNIAVWPTIRFLATRCGLERDIVVPMTQDTNTSIKGSKTITVPYGKWTVECLENLLVSPDVSQNFFIQNKRTHKFQFELSLIM